MAQLENANKKANAAHTPTNLASPTLSSNTDLFSVASPPTNSDFASSDADVGNQLISDQMSKSSDVMDWIAKARESLQQFGGYINMGGPGTRGLDDEGGDQLESALTDDEVDIAIEYVDGEDHTEFGGSTIGDHASGDEGTMSRRRGSNTASEASLRRGSSTGRLPTDEASPFGLMAKLSLMTRKRRASRPSSEAGEEEGNAPQVGVPSNDYFKPCGFFIFICLIM